MKPYSKSSILFTIFVMITTGNVIAQPIVAPTMAKTASTPIPPVPATESTPTTDPETFYPYLGLDFKWQRTEGKNDWNKVIAKNYPGASIYAGERFCKNWGIEFGYGETLQKTKTHSFTNGETFFDSRNASGAIVSTKVKFRSGYFDLNGYYPITPCFDLIASVGGGLVRPKIRVNIPVSGPANRTTGFFPQDVNALHSIKGKTRGFARLGAGLQYLISDCIGLRGMVRWETTSFARAHGRFDFQQGSINTGELRRPFKDTVSATVGIFCKL
jgi:hypothetical protein